MINLLLFSSIIFCDIKGEVSKPGVYIANDANIQSIIELAGGLTKNADTSKINLSKKVTDEMVIYIPNKNKVNQVCNCPLKIINCNDEVSTTKITTTHKVTTIVTTTTKIPMITTKIVTKININEATLSELITLKGIGNVIAQRIVDYRSSHPFIVIEDILNINGIGESLFAQIKDSITV